MFIKNIKIKNFKYFKDEVCLSFLNPLEDNNGLNILVGDNNTGKTTIFKAIDFLFNGLGTGKSENDYKNKNNINEDLEIELEFIGENLEELLDTKYHKCIYNNDGFEYIKIKRTSKNYSITQGTRTVNIDVKKLLVFNTETNQFENISGFDKAFLRNFDFGFIWANTQPEELTKYGSTTIVGKLIKRMSEGFTEQENYKQLLELHKQVFNVGENSLKSKMDDISSSIQEVFREQFGNVDISFNFDEIGIDSYFKNTKIKINDGIETNLEEKGSGMQKAMALAILQAYIQINNEDKPFYFFIDEPEISLHPIAQLKLSKSLSGGGEYKQFFLTTHSSYIFKELYNNSKIFIFSKEDNNININESINVKLFPFGPTVGEINYFAYGIKTTDFHNELYGYLQEKSGIFTEREFDNWLREKLGDDIEVKDWIPEKKGVVQDSKERTIQVYIRNKIHHPENRHNEDYTEEQFEKSIKQMIDILKNLDN